ncbi:MAG: hypothetical protein HRU20_14960 [Pseudomonadales bacterium]|nr:hypothetical protein [Pseudomonadales bacterium]
MEEYYGFVYSKLLDLYPNKPWSTIMSKMTSKKKNPISIEKLGERIMAYGLDLWEKGDFSKYDEYQKSAIAESMFYSGKFLEFYNSILDEDKASLKSRFGAAFKESQDMRALVFELFTYNYLSSKGYLVESKDSKNTSETYDYLITKDHEVQVECKSFSNDKGLYINNSEAQELNRLILERGLNIEQPPESSITFLTLEMLSIFPKSNKGKQALLDEIYDSLDNGLLSSEKFKLHLEVFYNLDNIEAEEVWRELPSKVYGIELAYTISTAKGKKSRTALRITSTAKEAFWREFENKCKDAAKRQLSSDKAGSIFVHISNLDTYKELKSSDRFKNKLKNIFNQHHILSLVLVSNISVYEQVDYPFFYVSPLIKEFKNDECKFYKVGRLSE